MSRITTNLSERTALVTGAAQGLGRCIAQTLAAAGAKVTAVDRSAERLKRLAANFGRLRLEAEIAVANALAFEAAPFDATLIDAPCTATGTIRRHPDVAWTKRQAIWRRSANCRPS